MNIRRALPLAFLPFAAPLFAQMDMELPGFDEETPKEIRAEDILPRSKKPADMTLSVPSDCDAAGFDAVLNFPGVLKIRIMTADGKFFSFKVTPQAQTRQRKISMQEAFGRTKVEIAPPAPTYANEILRIPELDIPYFVRPNFERYNDVYADKHLMEWDAIPDALVRTTRFDFRTCATGIRIYMDGRFAGEYRTKSKLRKLNITGGTGPVITNLKGYRNEQSTTDWEVPDFRKIVSPGAGKDVRISLKSGFSKVNGVPFFTADGAGSADLSLARATRGIFALEVDYYLARDAFERLPEAFITSVPNGFYRSVHLLFALDPNPEKVRRMTVRLTRFCSEGRGSGLFHNDIELPADDTQFPSNIRAVGTAVFQQDGKEVTVPLYEGEFPINCGEIMDIINDDPHPRARNKKHPYLDFELFGPRNGVGSYVTGELKPSSKKSAFRIFGVALARAPLAVVSEPEKRGNIFINDETPETSFRVTAEKTGSYAADWTVFDTDRKEVLKSGSIPLELKAGEARKLTIPLLTPKDIGHYHLDFALREANGKEPFLNHHAMFTILGKDTRQATAEESPFGLWWFGGAHHTSGDPDVAFPLIRRAGVRHAPFAGRAKNPATGEPNLKFLEQCRKYGITLGQLPWIGGSKLKLKDGEEAALQTLHDCYDPLIRAFPECKFVTIFHESYGDPLPPELFGTEVTEKSKRDREFTDIAIFVAKFFRKFHPHVKLSYGNNTSSSGLVAALLRNDFPQEYFDFIGIETPGQGCIPERLWQGGVQGSWFALETAKHFKRDARVTACFEFTSRPLRLLGLRKQAEYMIRDGLIGLGYGYETVELGSLSDVGNGYIQTIWGSSGLCTRNPEIYPKPFYTAVAAMTKVLDRIEFRPKILNLGSNSVYALEFRRKSGDYVYAFWMPARSGKLEFQFKQNASATAVDFFGRETAKNGSAIVCEVSSAPAYLITKEPADTVRYLGNIAEAEPPNRLVAEPLVSPESWRMLPAANMPANDGALYRTRGKFTFQPADDPEQGKCMELSLVKEGFVRDFMGEYTKLQLRNPIQIPGNPSGVALSVKGDGGWEKIAFEFQDAKGRLFRTDGYYHDFGAETFVNFTSWRTIRFPIDAEGRRSPVNQSLGGRWNSDSGGWAAVFPIRLTALYVTMFRKALNPCVMTENPCVLRLKDLGVYYNDALPAEKPVAVTSPNKIQEDENLMYFEDFARFDPGTKPAFYGNRAVVSEENAIRYLTLKSGDFLPSHYYLLEGSDYRVKTRVRLSSDRGLLFRIHSQGPREDYKYASYDISVTNSYISASCVKKEADEPRPDTLSPMMYQFTKHGLSELPPDRWINLELEVHKDTLRVSADVSGKMEVLFDGKIHPGSGKFFLSAKSPVDIQYLQIAELAKTKTAEVSGGSAGPVNAADQAEETEKQEAEQLNTK